MSAAGTAGPGRLRRTLDGLYGAGLAGACLAMVAIAVLVLAQVAGRIVDRAALALGRDPLGLAVPSLAEIGGFLFVGAACLALPATLRAAGHVRVTLALGRIPPGPARALTGLVLALGAGLAGFATWHSAAQALDSLAFASTSFGIVRVPLWIPQGVMTLGLGLLLVALLDELVTLLAGGTPAFRRAETARGAAHG
jgi:TRAP-type C4-dicarboxylate transport system permease small subunit